MTPLHAAIEAAFATVALLAIIIIVRTLRTEWAAVRATFGYFGKAPR